MVKLPTLPRPELVTGKNRKPRHTSFDPKTLKHLPTPHARIDPHGNAVVDQVCYWDPSTRGFGLRVSSTGTKTWVWMGRVPRDGKRVAVRYALADYAERESEPGLTLAKARAKAHGYQLAADRGEDPREREAHAQREVERIRQEQLRRTANTFAALAEEFLATHHPKHKTALKPSSLRRYRGLLLGSDTAAWMSRPVSDIRKRDVIDLLSDMQRRKASHGGRLGLSVNRMYSTLRRFFRWCVQRDLLEVSPVSDVERPLAEVRRDRHLFGRPTYNKPSELALLWRASDALGTNGALIKLLMLTGQRLSEVSDMTYRELIDLDGKNPRWLIPKERTKNGKEHLVPLGPLAVKIIQAVPRMTDRPFVFGKTGTTPFSGFSRLKARIDKQLAVMKERDPARSAGQFEHPWRFHDLRRSFKTGLQELRITSDVRDALVNHTPQGLAAVYEHAELLDAKREAVLAWEGHITQLLAADAAVTKTTSTGRTKKC